MAFLGLSLLFGIATKEASTVENRSRLEERLKKEDIDSVKVDKKFVKYDLYERGLMVACIISELGEWRYLEDENIRQKATAMSYVILRRAEQGYFLGKHDISANILAPNQFYGMTQRFNSFLPGKPEAHVARSKLNEGYFESMKKDFETNTSEYMRQILHLMPSDTTTGTDASNFDRVFNVIKEVVDSVLERRERDNSNGSLYFGYIGDVFASKYHQPKNMVAAFGNLGPYKSAKELLKDPKIRDGSYRMRLYKEKGVDAIFFFK